MKTMEEKTEKSKILRALINEYDGLQPNEHIQRKIDYYLTPYIDISLREENKFQGEPGRHMKFDMAKDIYKQMNDSKGMLQKQYQEEPTKICQEISGNGWDNVKAFVFNDKNKVQIQNIGRFILMKDETDDYLTKMDLIDYQPELFIDSPENPKLSKDEIEKLRIIATGDKELYKSKKSTLSTSYQELKLMQNQVLKDIKAMEKRAILAKQKLPPFITFPKIDFAKAIMQSA